MLLIDPATVADLAGPFPRRPGRLRHCLADHPLLGYPALAEAARAMPPHLVERRVHNAADGQAFRKVEADSDAAAAIAAGGAADQWIMLRGVEHLPRYRDLLEELLGELAPLFRTANSPVRDIKGFVFVSPPNTHTPFHFDAEFNILFQIAGTKVFASFPPAPPFLDLATREAYHRSGENMLEWDDAYAGSCDLNLLRAGDAVYVPYASPHWVRAGREPSISLSVTWQTPWSHRVTDALGFNPLARRLGLGEYDPARQPDPPVLRAVMGRIGQRVGLL